MGIADKNVQNLSKYFTVKVLFLAVAVQRHW